MSSVFYLRIYQIKTLKIKINCTNCLDILFKAVLSFFLAIVAHVSDVAPGPVDIHVRQYISKLK